MNYNLVIVLIAILFGTVAYIFYLIKKQGVLNLEMTKMVLIFSAVLEHLRDKELSDEDIDKIRKFLKTYNPE
jgi:hypothetical protein